MIFKMIFVLSFLVSCIVFETHAQQVRVVFYNVENLFDTRDDSLTNDDEFLPDGDKNWTYERFHRKIVRIYQTLVALGEGEMPAVIGLCEIENREVLERLIYDTPLKKWNYRIVHRESPDARGIDVALLYRRDLFRPDSAEWLRVPLSVNEKTREILHVTGCLFEKEPIHFYVNHWPSRYGGAGSSGAKRLAAASTLAASVKKVYEENVNSNIVIMGDFNDEPGDESIKAINKILMNNDLNDELVVVNLSEKRTVADLSGTLKHQGAWNIFDQVLVSSALISGSNGIIVLSEKAEIFDAGFLLEPDETYTGFKPFRTYVGPGYHNGFSDHLPVSILIEKTFGSD
jgi:predicted extracellular nuclease